MKKLILLFAITLLALSSASALDPIKVAIINTSGVAVDVQVKLNDYTGGTANLKYTGPVVTLTPNGSGIIITEVSDNSNSEWSQITPAQVNSYYILDVYVNGNLYAQYRLDQQILNQSQGGTLDNDGNLVPPIGSTSSLGSDENRWEDAFISSNTLHVGPNGGLTGGTEMTLSYDYPTNSGTISVDGIESLKINSTGTTITGDLIADPTGTNKSLIVGDNNLDYNGTASAVERKLYFNGSKAAFRVGNIDKNVWDDGANVGLNSIAMGGNPLASGISSFSIGNATEATAYGALAMGFLAKSTGFFTNAIGNGVIADEASSIALGMNNDATITGEILTVGNGVNDANRSNALEVYKNGEIVIPALGNGSSIQILNVNANGKLVAGGSTLSVANGGTGTTTLTSGNFLQGNGTGAITATKAAPTGTVVGTTDTQTLTNKTIDSDNNTISNIENANIKTGAAIDATKLADGTVTNTELQYIGTVTSDVQTQLDGKQSNLPTQTGNAGKYLKTNGTNLSWDDVLGGAFTSSGGITKGNSFTDDFLFGTNTITHNTGTEYKFFFDKGKGAFRTGGVSGTQWEGANLGEKSFASGINPIAKGENSVSMGYYTEANGESSIALGRAAKAEGLYSVALGNNTTAAANYSTAMGALTNAVGNYSTAMGNSTTATGANSTSMGYETKATAVSSVAMGYNTEATAQYGLAVGKYNDPTSSHIFVVGIGTGDADRKNGFVVTNGGNITMGNSDGNNHTVYGSMKINDVLDANGSTGSVAVHFSATAPTSPINGSLWYDSTNSLLKIWNGTTWLDI